MFRGNRKVTRTSSADIGKLKTLVNSRLLYFILCNFCRNDGDEIGGGEKDTAVPFVISCPPF